MSEWRADKYGPGPNNTCRDDGPCDLHAAIARALEEYGDEEYQRGVRETVQYRRSVIEEIEGYRGPEDADVDF